MIDFRKFLCAILFVLVPAGVYAGDISTWHRYSDWTTVCRITESGSFVVSDAYISCDTITANEGDSVVFLSPIQVGAASSKILTDGSAQFDTVTIGALTVSGPALSFLNVTGEATIGDNGDTVAINSSDWDIDENGNCTGFGTVYVDGAATLESTVVINGALTVNEEINVTDDFTLGDSGDTGSINTDDWAIDATGIQTGMGNITSNGIISSAEVTISQDLTVADTASLAGDVDMTATGGTSGSADFDVAGYAQFADTVEIDGPVYLDGTMQVDTVNERTAGNGVIIESVNLEDDECTAGYLYGNGAGVTSINGSEVTTGTVAGERVADSFLVNDGDDTTSGSLYASTVYATLNGNGASVTAINAGNIATGTLAGDLIADSFVTNDATDTISGDFYADTVFASLSGNGKNVSGLNASSVISGTLRGSLVADSFVLNTGDAVSSLEVTGALLMNSASCTGDIAADDANLSGDLTVTDTGAFGDDVTIVDVKAAVSSEANRQDIQTGSFTVVTVSGDTAVTVTFGTAFSAAPSVVMTPQTNLSSDTWCSWSAEDVTADTFTARVQYGVGATTIDMNYIAIGDD